MRALLLILFFVIIGGMMLVATQQTPSPSVSDPALAWLNAEATLTIAQHHLNTTASVENATHQALQHQMIQITLDGALTQRANEGTATQFVRNLDGTATQISRETEAAQTAQAATMQAEMLLTSIPLTATPQRAELNAITRQDELDAQYAYWQRYAIPIKAVAPTLLILFLIILLILAAVVLYPHLVQLINAKEMQMRTVTNHRGEVETVIINGNQRVTTLMPHNAFGHSMRHTAEGVQVDRAADGANWQDRVITHEQLIRLMEAYATQQKKQNQTATRIFRQAFANGDGNNQIGKAFAPPPQAAAPAPLVLVMDPDSPEVREILHDVEQHLVDPTFL